MSVLDTFFDIFGGHTIGGTPSILGNGPPDHGPPPPTHMDAGRYDPGVAGYPYTAICYVVATFPDGHSIRGTGAMVGPNDVLTAGQMLWDTEHGGAAVSVTVTPGYNDGVAPFGTFQGALISYFPIDQDGNGIVNHDEVQWDVGIIGLSKNVGGQTGSFGIKTHPLTGPNSEPESLILTGYPASLDGDHGPRMMNDLLACPQ